MTTNLSITGSLEDGEKEVANIFLSQKKRNCSIITVGEHFEAVEHRRPSHSLIHLEAREKNWFQSSIKCHLDDLKKLHEIDNDLIDKKDYFTGYAAIHWAAKKGRVDVAEWLHERNADMNARTNGGYSPLHIATIHGKDEFVRYLSIVCNADIHQRDYSGRKPGDYSHEMPLTVNAKQPSNINLLVNGAPVAFPVTGNNRSCLLSNSNSMVFLNAGMPPITEEESSLEMGKGRRKKSLVSREKSPKRSGVFREKSPRRESRSGGTLRWRTLSVPDFEQAFAPFKQMSFNKGSKSNEV